MKKNVFKELEPKAKLPAEARQNVLKNIEAAKLMLDFWDLFATKRVEMGMNVLSQAPDITNDKKSKK